MKRFKRLVGKLIEELEDLEASERLLKIILVLLICLVAFQFFLVVGRGLISDQPDFASFYNAASMIREGDLNIYDRGAFVSHSQKIGLGGNPYSYLYPPLFALLVIPLTLVGFSVAKLFWFILNVGLLLLSLLILSRLQTSLPKQTGLLAILVITAVFSPLYLNFSLGQSNVFILFLLCGWLLALSKGFNWRSGACLAGAILIKPFFLFILLYLLIKRHWLALSATLTYFFILVVATLPFTSLNLQWIYLRFLAKSLISLDASVVNQSLSGFFSRLLAPNTFTYPWAVAPELARWLTYLLGGLVLLITLWFCWKGKKQDLIGLEISTLIAAIVLTAPLGREHHFIWLLITFTFLLGYFVQSQNHFGLLAAVALSFVVISGNYVYYVPALGQGIWQLAISVKFYGLVLLWSSLIVILSLERKKVSEVGGSIE